ncbi:MAG: NUDIX hydrolase [Chloracidobacterium sp.]|nr:NUDIX hydrolase [Chloracidobacterium sp.]
MPETTHSESIYKGRVFDVRLDTIVEDGVEYQREMVVHRGSAVIVPLFDDGTVALVKQYRHPAGDYLLEVPAGSLEDGEDALTGARRELEEEIGVTAAKLEKIAEFYVSPGFLTEKMYVFLATEITETEQQLEEDELIKIERIPLTEAAQMARDGRIVDAKTIIGLLTAETMRP